jgi:D,D-heptose 1,7-bisphosphate phosphatase
VDFDAKKEEVAVQPKRAVFLDRDGTIIEDTGYLRRAQDVRLLPKAAQGLQLLQSHGYYLIVVTNQSGLARGIFNLAEMEAVKERFLAILSDAGIQLADYYFCPHHPQGVVEEYRKICTCRKGAPGMLLTGAGRHGIDLKRSWMIGDKDDDVRAGIAAGTRTIRIGHNAGTVASEFSVDNLLDAGKIILQNQF